MRRLQERGCITSTVKQNDGQALSGQQQSNAYVYVSVADNEYSHLSFLANVAVNSVNLGDKAVRTCGAEIK